MNKTMGFLKASRIRESYRGESMDFPTGLRVIPLGGAICNDFAPLPKELMDIGGLDRVKF